MTATLGAILLAGGRATRLGGADKPLIELGGHSLLQRTVDAARNAGANPIVVVGPESVAMADTIRVREEPEFAGPAAGIVTALAEIPSTASPEWMLVLACDLEHPDAAVRHLVADLPSLAASAEGLYLSDSATRPQWLTGIYRTAALRRAAATAPHRGRDLPVRRLLGALSITSVTVRDDDVRDIDTWEDWENARQREGETP